MPRPYISETTASYLANTDRTWAVATRGGSPICGVNNIRLCPNSVDWVTVTNVIRDGVYLIVTAGPHRWRLPHYSMLNVREVTR